MMDEKSEITIKEHDISNISHVSAQTKTNFECIMKNLHCVFAASQNSQVANQAAKTFGTVEASLPKRAIR